MWLALAILSFALRAVRYFGAWLYVADLVVSIFESFCDRKNFDRGWGFSGITLVNSADTRRRFEDGAR